VIVSFKIKGALVPFIYMDRCPEDVGGSLYVRNHYLSTVIYLLVELQLGDYSTCPMDE
jgi:hypothetical protein